MARRASTSPRRSTACGWILGPIVGGHFVFSGGEGSECQCRPVHSLLGHRHFCRRFAASFLSLAKVPDLHAEDESKKSADQKNSLKPSGGQLAGIGVALAIVCGLLYFFIAPILGLVWALLNLPRPCSIRPNTACSWPPTLPAFLLVSKNWDMFRRKHFTLGIGTQFLYVAAQTGIFSFCVNYILENDPGVTNRAGLALAGRHRFCPVHGRTPLRQRCHQPVQAASGAGGLRGHQCRADGGVHGRRQTGPVCDVRHVLLHVRHVPDDFRAGHPRAGRLHQARLLAHRHVHRGRGDCARRSWATSRDTSSMRDGFVVPLVCFVFIAIYGAVWQKLEAKDSAA